MAATRLIGIRLKCYLLRYSVAGGDFAGEHGWACIMDSDEDEARRTLVAHFDAFRGEVTINTIRRCPIIEGGYQLLRDGEQPPESH